MIGVGQREAHPQRRFRQRAMAGLQRLYTPDSLGLMVRQAGQCPAPACP